MAVDNRFNKLEALSKSVKEKRNKSKDVTKSEAFTNLRLIANKAKNERAVENARRSEPESDRDINIGIRQFGNKNSNTGISKTKYIKNLEGASNLDELIKSKEKTSPQSLRSVTPEEIVSTRVEKDPRPSLLDALVNSQKGQSHISGAKVIQSALKDYGGDPDEIYDTSKTSADRRLAYEMAARNDPDNPLTKAENTKINIDMPKKQVQDEILSYTMMTDEEKRRYNEIYGMYGKFQAEEYRGRLQDAINQRIAEEQVKSDREIQNPFGRTVYMFGQGMASGVAGVGESAEWFSGMDRKKPTSVGEYTASGIRNDEDNSVAENVIYDIAQSTGYMAPGIITSGALGALGASTKAAQAGGNVLFGLAQSGNTYRQDINEGQDPDKAWLHGLQQGVDETATNWLLGGVNAFGGGALKRVIANSGAGRAFTSGIDKIAKSQTGRVLLRRVADSLADMGSEAAQEYLQFYTENLTRNLLYGEENSLDPLDPDAWYSAALGALNAGLLNMPGNIARTARGLSADVSMAKDTSEALDLDRSHYRSSEDYRKVETLKKVADEVASKAEAGTVSISDKVAYSEALADVLTSEANTEYNTESINNTDQVNVRMLEVSTGSDAEIKRTMDEATEQWRKILTNPEMTAAVSTDGISAYDIERQGEDLIFTHSIDGEVREQQAYKIADIGKGGDADILNVVPLQSSDPAVPKLNTFVDYAKSSGLKETAAVNESSTPAPETSVISGQNNSQADVSAPAAVRQDTAVRPVSAEDRSEFGSYANVYSAALGSKRSTDNMINLWDGKNRDRYLTAYKRIYTAGLNDIDVDTMLRDPMNIYLTDRQREQAYKDGMLDANERKRNRKEFAKGEAREGGITKGSEQASTEQRDFLNWIGDKTGLKIEVREGLKGNAEINLDKGVMRINPYSKDFVGSVSHELTHMIKVYAPGEYDTLQRLTVSALMRSRNVSYDELYKTYEEKYRTEVDPDYTVEDVLEEITADGATAYMNDQDFANRIAREDRSLAKKIADFFKGIADTLKKLINEKGIRNVGRVMRENEAQYRMAANTWYNALEKAAARYKAGDVVIYESETAGEKYSIMETDSGIRYVNVDTDQDLFDGKSPSQQMKIAEKILKDRFVGRIFGISNGGMSISGRSAHEYRGGKQHSQEIVNAKARLAPEIGNFAESAKFIKHENDDGGHPEAIGGWDYYDGYFRINDGVISKDYVAQINVINKKDGRFIYDVHPIKETDELVQQIDPESVAQGSVETQPSVVINNIPQNPENNNKTRFQLDSPIEETRDLIAVRNVSQRDLSSMLELEGLPSPSIAITKADIGHTQFGDVTFIFGKGTIDPEANSLNQVWDADAWTPTFPKSRVEREINKDNLSGINKRLIEYMASRGDNVFNDTMLDPSNFEDRLRRNGYDIKDAADNSYDLKLLYLSDTGRNYETFPTYTEYTPYVSFAANEDVAKIAEELNGILSGYDFNGSQSEKREFIKEYAEEISRAFSSVTGKLIVDDGLPIARRNARISLLLSGIKKYLNGESTSRTVIDTEKAKADIDAMIDLSDYHKWAEDTFKDVIGDKGIRNDKDTFTRTGIRRSFRQLHDPYTAENIVKVLWSGKEQGVAELGLGTAKTVRGATTNKFGSVADMHNRSDRLKSIIPEEEQAVISGG